ncbi:type II toxin-antitoxin system Phd/YefM family antitoxin [Acidithiobacillus ferrianus]|uniref:type II toxin-antitoxin system Phd/YefM family antitoxin n=1 Tax=Acidithiobacillus ferrianus TaxID=2678518 RepID=UPI003F738F9F
MSTVNLTDDAKARLPYHVARAVQGEEIIILREGEPVARLVGMEPERKRRPVGLGAGRFHIPPDFDTLASAEILRLFEGPAE